MSSSDDVIPSLLGLGVIAFIVSIPFWIWRYNVHEFDAEQAFKLQAMQAGYEQVDIATTSSSTTHTLAWRKHP